MENILKLKFNHKSNYLIVFEFAVSLLFLSVFYFRINNDFWNDEIYTLKHFVFTDFYSTITDYHVPNNHIFFNLINSIYLKTIGIESLSDLMDSPYVLRIIPFLYTSFTVIFTYKIGRLLFDRRSALLAVTILISSIPFFNFALQIRGYGLSSLLFIILSYRIFLCLKGQLSCNLLLNALLSCLLIYTVPSNFYTVFCLLFFLSLHCLLQFRDYNSFKSFFTCKEVKLIYSILLGVILCLLFYIPIFSDVFNNEYVIPGERFEVAKLIYYSKHFFIGVASNRLFILPFILIGLAVEKNIKQHLLYFVVLFVPIFLLFIRGDNVPLRSFIPYLPLIAVFSANLLVKGIQQLKLKPIFEIMILVLISCYCVLQFAHENKVNESIIIRDIKLQNRTQNFYTQYYSNLYQPLKDMRSFNKIYNRNPLPVIIYGCEVHGIPYYLSKFDIEINPLNSLDSLLKRHDEIYIVTNHPNFFMDDHKYKSLRINNKLTYHNIIIISLNKTGHKKVEEYFSENLNKSVIFSDGLISDFNNIPDLGKKVGINCSDNINLGNVKYFIKNEKDIIVISRKKSMTKLKLFLSSYFNKQKVIVQNELFIMIEFSGKLDIKLDDPIFTLDYSEIKERIKNENLYIQKNKNDYCEILSKQKIYLNLWENKFSLLSSDSLILAFEANFKQEFNVSIVITVKREKEVISYKAIKLSDYFDSKITEIRIKEELSFSEAIRDSDIIHIYLWNQGETDLKVDNIRLFLK